MDRTGTWHMGCPDDDYKLIVIIGSAYVLHSKLMVIVVCCPVRRFVVTLRLHERRVAMCPSDNRRNGASLLAWRSPPSSLTACCVSWV